MDSGYINSVHAELKNIKNLLIVSWVTYPDFNFIN